MDTPYPLPPAGAHLPYIPSPEYAARKARQLRKEFPVLSDGSLEATARAFGLKDWHAVHHGEPLPGHRNLNDELLSPEDLAVRRKWQVEAIRSVKKLNLGEVQSFVARWNLTGASRGGRSGVEATGHGQTRMLEALRLAGRVEGEPESNTVYEAFAEYVRLDLGYDQMLALDKLMETYAWTDLDIARGVVRFMRWALEATEDKAGARCIPLVLAYGVSHPASVPRTVTLTAAQRQQLESEVRSHLLLPCEVARLGVVVQPYLGTDCHTQMLSQIFTFGEMKHIGVEEPFDVCLSHAFVLVGVLVKLPVNSNVNVRGLAASSMRGLAASLEDLQSTLTIPELSHTPLRFREVGGALGSLAFACAGTATGAVQNLVESAARQHKPITISRVSPEIPLSGPAGYDIQLSFEQHEWAPERITVMPGHRPMRMLAWLLAVMTEYGVEPILDSAPPSSAYSSEALPGLRADWFVAQMKTPSEFYEHATGDEYDEQAEFGTATPDVWRVLANHDSGSLARVHELCLPDIETCDSYAAFLETQFDFAATRAAELDRHAFTLVIRGRVTQPGFHLPLPDSVRTDVTRMLTEAFGLTSVEVSPVALVSMDGYPLWNERWVLDVCKGLKGAPLAQVYSRTQTGTPEPCSLVIFFSVADGDIETVFKQLRKGRGECTIRIAFETFNPEPDSPAQLMTVIDVLGQTGVSRVDGQDMQEGFARLEYPVAVCIVVSRILNRRPGVPTFVVTCEARMTGGAIVSGKLAGTMPALYVAWVQARCDEWSATLEVHYDQN